MKDPNNLVESTVFYSKVFYKIKIKMHEAFLKNFFPKESYLDKHPKIKECPFMGYYCLMVIHRTEKTHIQEVVSTLSLTLTREIGSTICTQLRD